MKSNWKGRSKNGLSDDFGPPFAKTKKYLLSYNATVAKGIMLCSQHIVLVIWMEFPFKHYQVSLLLTRKEKLPKCHEIPIMSSSGKKHFSSFPLWMWLKNNPKLDFQKLFSHQNGRFCFTANSQPSHLFRLATPISPGFHFLVYDSQNQNQQTEMLKKDVKSTTETRKWASVT